MDAMQSKIQEIMKESDLSTVASEMIAKIHDVVANYADAIAIQRCNELGVEDHDSHEAHKIYYSAETMITAAILREMKNINDHA